ncbi:DUF6626 family protein [Sphingomonas sp. LR55]|uniref:DUF6626 family protein n=1 Tax=Sphingomonas sp. LR55 TaxID=3050231 RepID=UPI003FA6AC4E
MILDDVFLFLKGTGAAQSHAVFSTVFLGHSPRYYDYLRCSGAKPSLHSLLKLAICLRDMARAGTGSPVEALAGDLAHRVMSRALTQCR